MVNFFKHPNYINYTISHTFLADALLKTWCKYRYGVFDENGYFDDHYYPQSYAEGNQTLPNAGCQLDDFTRDNSTGKRYTIEH